MNDVLNCLSLSHPLFLFFFILQWMGRNRRHRGRFVNCSPARGGSQPCSDFRSGHGFNEAFATSFYMSFWSTVTAEYWLSLALQRSVVHIISFLDLSYTNAVQYNRFLLHRNSEEMHLTRRGRGRLARCKPYLIIWRWILILRRPYEEGGRSKRRTGRSRVR